MPCKQDLGIILGSKLKKFKNIEAQQEMRNSYEIDYN